MAGSVTSETPRWRKSTYSGSVNCVEIGELPDDRIGIRNSRDAAQVPTVFTRAEIDAFFKAVKAGEFDDLT
jgi:hypothetical protein